MLERQWWCQRLPSNFFGDVIQWENMKLSTLVGKAWDCDILFLCGFEILVIAKYLRIVCIVFKNIKMSLGVSILSAAPCLLCHYLLQNHYYFAEKQSDFHLLGTRRAHSRFINKGLNERTGVMFTPVSSDADDHHQASLPVNPSSTLT